MTRLNDIDAQKRILRIKGVTKAYGNVTVLEHLDLSVNRNELVGLIGPNGAGKTTLLEIIEGVNRPTSGSITLFDEDPQSLSNETRGRIGLVFQRNSLPGYISVRHLVEIFKHSHGAGEESERFSVQLGLAHLWDRRIDELSAGQQQRVAVFVALIGARDFVLLDEPTSALDIKSRHAVWDAIAERKRTTGLAGILATHHMTEAMMLCDRLCFLKDGYIIAQGSTSQFVGDGRVLALRFQAPEDFVGQWQVVRDLDLEVMRTLDGYEVACPRQQLPQLLHELIAAEQSRGFSANIAISERDLERKYLELFSGNG